MNIDQLDKISSKLPLGLDLREIQDYGDLEPVFALRVTAWRTRLTLSPAIEKWEDPEDRISRHFAIYHKSKPVVAAARMSNSRTK